MKTSMQELIERLNNVKPQDFCSIETIKGWAKELLEKEKKVIMDAYMAGESDATHKIDSALKHYDKTFNTKEK